ncbi:helix-turn-helix transcriptional regulator [Candidatus Poribacteria bacterium]|nr:helix-turn-helix transcriptional regulator [Candidatus Poribacteria bacterium]
MNHDSECSCCAEDVTGSICECPGIIKERFSQPCLLLLLHQKPSYGYELIDDLSKMGSPADASAVYKNLRKMEQDGLVESQWDTSGPGPAKRYYQLTPEGEELLHAWAITVRQNKSVLEGFLSMYEKQFQSELTRH